MYRHSIEIKAFILKCGTGVLSNLLLHFTSELLIKSSVSIRVLNLANGKYFYWSLRQTFLKFHWDYFTFFDLNLFWSPDSIFWLNIFLLFRKYIKNCVRWTGFTNITTKSALYPFRTFYRSSYCPMSIQLHAYSVCFFLAFDNHLNCFLSKDLLQPALASEPGRTYNGMILLSIVFRIDIIATM